MAETGRLLAESAAVFVARRRGAGGGGAAELWREIVELGWLGLLVPEEDRGSGLSGRELAALGVALGPLLRPDPIVPAIAAASILAGLETGEARALLGEVLDGHAVLVPASAPLSADPIAPTAQSASSILAWDPEGERVVVIPARDPAINWAHTVDGGSIASLPRALRASGQAAGLGSGPQAFAAFDRGADALALGLAGLLIGLAQRALDLTCEYLRTREQFGVPIGSFQAVQHRVATLHVAISSSRALVREAGLAFEGPHRTAACAAARSRAAETAMSATEEAVQLHGAIGYTAEHEAGCLLKRALALRSAGGSPAAWRSRFLERSTRQQSRIP